MSRQRYRTSRVSGPALVLGLLVALLAQPAVAAVSEAEAARQLEQAYGVKALKVRAGDVGGRAVWLVTVMNPDSDSNAAFQVNTLAVDQETGELVPAYRHGTSGYGYKGDSRRDDKVGLRPDAMRSGVWR